MSIALGLRKSSVEDHYHIVTKLEGVKLVSEKVFTKEEIAENFNISLTV